MEKKSNINISEWREFPLPSIFLINRGQRLTTQDQVSGDIAYISSTKSNNGIDNYIKPPDYMSKHKNVMTLNNSGSIGYCFYHHYDFVASDHCTVFDIKDNNIELTPHIALFLKPIIESMKTKYGFAREMSNDRLSNEKILLPAKKNGKEYIPDWMFMSNFILSNSQSICYDRTLTFPKKTLSLTSIKWQEFKVNSLFKLSKGERIVESERVSGETPLITASAYDNGITSLIDESCFMGKKKLFQNKITVDMFGNVFYHNYKYFSDDNIHTLILKDNFKIELSMFCSLFIVSILKKLSSKYGFGRQVRLHRLESEVISLPIKSKNKPDWEFMENYIKS